MNREINDRPQKWEINWRVTPFLRWFFVGGKERKREISEDFFLLKLYVREIESIKIHRKEWRERE